MSWQQCGMLVNVILGHTAQHLGISCLTAGKPSLPAFELSLARRERVCLCCWLTCTWLVTCVLQVMPAKQVQMQPTTVIRTALTALGAVGAALALYQQVCWVLQ